MPNGRAVATSACVGSGPITSRYEPSPNDSSVFAVPMPTWRPPWLGVTPIASRRPRPMVPARSVVRRGRGGRRRPISCPGAAPPCALIWTNARRMLDSARLQRRRLDRGGRRGLRPGSRPRRWPSAASTRRADGADRWIAASSYRPIAWLATTTSAGTSASRWRASLERVRAPRRPACRRRGSSLSVTSSVTRATLAATTQAKWGPHRSERQVPTRPPQVDATGCVQVTTLTRLRRAGTVVVPGCGFSRPNHSRRGRHPLHRSEQP